MKKSSWMAQYYGCAPDVFEARQGKQFFFEKKNQKTFLPDGVSAVRIVLEGPKRLEQP